MKEKLKSELLEKLENGEITQEEYDKKTEDIESGKFAPLGRGKREMPELTDEQKAEMKEKLKSELLEKLENGKITQEEYDKKAEDIESGKFAPLSRGKREIPELTDEQKAEMKEKFKSELLEKLENGEITQEEYDESISAIENGTYKPKHAPGGRVGRKPPKYAPEKSDKNVSE